MATDEELKEKLENYKSHRVVVSRAFMNIYTMQVCCVKDATDEEILACCNKDNPSGTANGWSRVVRDDVSPGQCQEDPDRYHYLVVC